MDFERKVFIASSTEGLPVAKALRDELSKENIEVKVWSDPGIFELSTTTIECLEDQSSRFDFAVVVLTPDDVFMFRSEEVSAPRDNLILELGMFIGRIGRRRTFIAKPKGASLKLPTDLAGVTVAEYGVSSDRKKKNYDLSQACDKIKRSISHAPLAPIDTLITSLIFSRHLLEYCLWVFEKYLKEPENIPLFKCQAQVTVTDLDGEILIHESPTSVGNEMQRHVGKVLWASLPINDTDKPIKVIFDSDAKRGWVLWADAGYSLIYTPISNRNNLRVCLVHFRRKSDKIYLLEMHHELDTPLDSEALNRIAIIISDRIRNLK
ncbi:MAG: nucleotide-binding protein [Planctomycetes bacterium]|nr:nucleotide-binding protein [Planctomycetota bacterium]MBL7144736.1 nucleotide-binding protein [Phycisphaerae bacterium]